MPTEYNIGHSHDVIYEFRPTNDQRINGMSMDEVNKCVCMHLLESEFGISIDELKEAFPEKFI
jgi:hypothetical protein